MSESSPQDASWERIWSFFASVKLSFALLLALALLSILGTVIPQKEHVSAYVQAFGESGARAIMALRLNDMYHAPWFLLLMSLLAVNLLICSLNRLPTTLKLMAKDPQADLKRPTPAQESLTLKSPPPDLAPKASAALAKAFGPVTQGQDGKTILLFSEKGAWSRLGVYLVHLSVLIIFLGAIIGNLFGFSGHLNLNQGGASDEIVLDNGEPHHLGFGLRLDKFTVSFYKDGMPSEYRSEVTFLDQGKEALRASLVVNDPAEFKGVDFYQSSYGQSPVSMTANLVRGEQTEKVTLKHGEWVDLPGGGQALLLEAREDVHMGDMYHGPAARIGYQGPGVTQPVGITAFKAGTSMPARGPVKFEILDMELVPYSGFSVKYDPGVWFIWLGCTLMVLGFLVTFYASHQKAWLRLIPLDKGRTRLELAGSANKNRFGLRRKIERLAGQLRADAPQGD